MAKHNEILWRLGNYSLDKASLSTHKDTLFL